MRCEVSTEHVLEDFEPFVEDPLVRLVSLMDHTPGQRQFVSIDKYREYNQGQERASETELDALIAKRREDQVSYGERHRAAIVRICEKYGLPLASHDDATRAHVEEAVQARMVIAEFPTTREAAAAAKVYGLAVVAGAPNWCWGVALGERVRRGAGGGWAAGHPLLRLRTGERAARRLPLPARGLPLPAAMATVTVTPAERAALGDRGEIVPGKRADLLRVRVVEDLPVVRGVWRGGVRIA